MAYAGGHAGASPEALGYPSHNQTPLPRSQSAAAGSAYPRASSYASQHPPSSSYSSQYFPTPAQSVQLPHGQYHASPSPTHYAPPASPEIERFACEKCDKTFSRAHDRKRHYESQHSTHPYLHRCRFCTKEFSRADSLKRHVDNGCEKDPSFQPE
ncbi:uncharacterized protein PHACADRAFT_258764 [Phanerochaete carnosa HHB-10118-sp]|uniref:C2H2-type domain-containing protein n=1 Tax=Phanerochaete carnosa (strain HHB-10118-sp) TaxID=650164 RepID=K5UXA8_PHACS|nr:uncharacterized protein PHACADRAFT_258764 [Phanerochaete carnosa HHB-10118-sp]EKM54731.1 hypothetical protein PHACADRAFT_258764 [Phanerochaete carnosa HHB-10118-sp]